MKTNFIIISLLFLFLFGCNSNDSLNETDNNRDLIASIELTEGLISFYFLRKSNVNGEDMLKVSFEEENLFFKTGENSIDKLSSIDYSSVASYTFTWLRGKNHSIPLLYGVITEDSVDVIEIKKGDKIYNDITIMDIGKDFRLWYSVSEDFSHPPISIILKDQNGNILK